MTFDLIKNLFVITAVQNKKKLNGLATNKQTNPL